MKLVSRILTLLILASATVFYSSCGGGDDNTTSETDQQLAKLNGTWVVVLSDDVTQNSKEPPFEFKNLTLKINAPAGSTTFNWTATNRPPQSPWNSQGTFVFGDPVASQLKRDDTVTIAYNVTDTKLIMTFDFDNSAGYPGRVKSIEGNWSFEFTKQQ